MILVTGASGFLGRHLVRYLSAKGEQVRALYHSHAPGDDLKALPGVEWCRGDLLDIYTVEEVMNGISDVYHCAAIVSFEPGQSEQILHFNTESTANIVNQALEQGIRKMVYVSSIAALGRTGQPGKHITEEEEWEESRHNSTYAVSKYRAEMEVWRGIGEGLNAAIVNPGIILGQAAPHELASRLMNIVYKEFPFYSRGVNSWVDVEDVVKIMVMLMHSDISAQRYIISAGNFSYKDIFAMMAKALNKKAPGIYISPFVTGIGWRLSALLAAVTGKPSVITRETAKSSNAICNYDNRKLLDTFPGFNYTPIDQAIERMARYFHETRKK